MSTRTLLTLALAVIAGPAKYPQMGELDDLSSSH
jgi:hypothetical protein